MAGRKNPSPIVAKAVTECLAVLRISERSKREYASALLGTNTKVVGKAAAGPALAKSHLGVLRVERLTAALLGLWFEQRFPEHLAKSTRKKGMIALRHFVTFCISQGWADSSLLQACRSMPSSEARRTWLHPEVVQAWGRIATEVLDEWRFFATRPRESQIGAWASPQSRLVPSRADLDRLADEVANRFADAEIPAPPHWGGYRLVPDEVEFWQGREGRLHDRIRFRLDGDDWVRERLAP